MLNTEMATRQFLAYTMHYCIVSICPYADGVDELTNAQML